MRLPLRAVSLVATTGLLAACAQTTADPRSTSPSSSLSTAMPTSVPAAKGEVTALAMVIEEDDGPRVCLGGVQESLPPQCDGPRLEGFQWSDVTSDEASGVEWAEPVRVTGTWDGTTLTLTAPAADEERPDTTAGPAPRTTCDDAERIHDEIWRDEDSLPPGALSGYPGSGCVELFVTYDDGSIQRALDAKYGDGVVVVLSALRPVGSGSSTG